MTIIIITISTCVICLTGFFQVVPVYAIMPQTEAGWLCPSEITEISTVAQIINSPHTRRSQDVRRRSVCSPVHQEPSASHPGREVLWQSPHVSCAEPQCHRWCSGTHSNQLNVTRLKSWAKGCLQLFMRNPSQSYEASYAKRDPTVLPANQLRWTCPTLNYPGRLVLHLTTPKGWKAKLSWVVGYIPRWFLCPKIVSHTGSN